MEEIVHAAHALDRRPDVKALILTGDGSKYFAAGADIKDMADQTYEEVQCLSISAKRNSGLCMLAHAITSVRRGTSSKCRRETIAGAHNNKRSCIVGSLKFSPGDAYPYGTALRETFMLLDLQLCMSCAGILCAA